MSEKQVLPENYYVDHFNELLAEIENLHSAELLPFHISFIERYKSLSLNAQKLLVRLCNNKHFTLTSTELQKYRKDCDVEKAIAELSLTKLFQILKTDEEAAPLLLKHFQNHFQIDYTKASENLNSAIVQHLLVQRKKSDPLIWENPTLYLFSFKLDVQFFEYLYFGNRHESMKLMALRDLKNISARSESGRLLTVYDWHLAAVRNLLRTHDVDLTNLREFLKIFAFPFPFETQSESVEKTLKLIWTDITDLKIEVSPLIWLFRVESLFIPVCKFLKRIKSSLLKEAAEQMIEIATSPQVSDYLETHFLVSKKKYQTEESLLQKNAEKVFLSHGLSDAPEKALRDYLTEKGTVTFYTENRIWNTLFGLVFWDALFTLDPVTSFYRHQSLDKKFYTKNQKQVDDILESLKTKEDLRKHVLKKFTLFFDKPQRLFKWNGEELKQLLALIEKSPEGALHNLLSKMVKDFRSYSSSFPDLMCISEDKISFIEVKSEGDKLNPGQYNRLQELIQLGFEAKVINIQWSKDTRKIYSVVDIETTGSLRGKTKITEFAAIKIQDGKIIGTYQTLINPKVKIPSFISRLTGINDAMVRKAPLFADVSDKIRDFLKDSIFVAHNVGFDYRFVQKEFNSLDQDFVQHKACTIALGRKKFKGLDSYSLKNMTDYLGIGLNNHHRAFCDALAASEILVRCLGYEKLDKSFLENNVQSFVTYDTDYDPQDEPQMAFDVNTYD